MFTLRKCQKDCWKNSDKAKSNLLKKKKYNTNKIKLNKSFVTQLVKLFFKTLTFE